MRNKGGRPVTRTEWEERAVQLAVRWYFKETQNKLRPRKGSFHGKPLISKHLPLKAHCVNDAIAFIEERHPQCKGQLSRKKVDGGFKYFLAVAPATKYDKRKKRGRRRTGL